MPSLHDLKILPDHFEDVMKGRKRAEIRRVDDRDFKVGDRARLWEWDPKSKAKLKYTGRAVLVVIEHIEPLDPVVKHYDMKELKIPMAVLSFGTRQVVTRGTPVPTE